MFGDAITLALIVKLHLATSSLCLYVLDHASIPKVYAFEIDLQNRSLRTITKDIAFSPGLLEGKQARDAVDGL